ncbi:polysaccharide export protein [Chitinispirillales bacterium ANBcel5]|uniref:polysaccharide biosynthesis/export family protein n=1 Tax=Cellulosispirillum alkaliphilum TaxID=3039283 RepID=UPI002A54EF00|nr:polysaccharide export protein [Chitinispirillales bacterium ANBcel5]
MQTIYTTILLVIVLQLNVYGQIKEYLLQAGDVISITVVEHPEFSGRHKIRPDGKINYPVVGEIVAVGVSPSQLVSTMQNKLSSYVNNPVVSVSIESYHSNKIFIIGNVVRSGEYEVYEPIDIIKALAMAGGLRKGRTREVRVIRKDGSVNNIEIDRIWGDTENRGGDEFKLYPGDTMYVPDSFEVPWGVIATIVSIVSVTLQIVVTSSRLGE